MRQFWEVGDIRPGTKVGRPVSQGLLYWHTIGVRRVAEPPQVLYGLFLSDARYQQGEFYDIGDGSREALAEHLSRENFQPWTGPS